MTPMDSFSLSIGTASTVRMPPSSMDDFRTSASSASVAVIMVMSSTWVTRRVLAARPVTVPSPRRCGPDCRYSAKAAGTPTSAAVLKTSPVVSEHHAELGLADAHRVLQHGLEDRL